MNNNDQNICTHCGFCCDGTLFNYANIKENEQIATGFSFEIIKKEEWAFKQPCPYFIKNNCVIYTERPYSVCESFQCKLLKALRTGNILFDDAMKIIDQTTELKTKIENQLLVHHPENMGDSLPAKMTEFNACFKETMSGEEFRKKYGKMVLDYFMLNKVLNNKFKNEKNRTDISSQ
jgi:hypothetical protein